MKTRKVTVAKPQCTTGRGGHCGFCGACSHTVGGGDSDDRCPRACAGDRAYWANMGPLGQKDGVEIEWVYEA